MFAFHNTIFTQYGRSQARLRVRSSRSNLHVDHVLYSHQFSPAFISFSFESKVRLRNSSLSFSRLSWSKITDKLTINWQNFVQVRLQFKFSCRMRPLFCFLRLKRNAALGEKSWSLLLVSVA